MNELLRRYGMPLTALFSVLTAFWLLILVILPYIYLFEESFRPYLPVTEVGGPNDTYSLNNYLAAFKQPSDWKLWLPLAWQPLIMPVQAPIHVQVFVHTILFSSLTTVLAFVLTYPIAYYLAKIANPKNVPVLFLLLLVPMWVSEILRAFAWFIILALKGPVNYGLIGLGVIADPIRWMTGYNSVILGLIYVYLLFMLLPVYNAVQSLDTNQIEAAEDLGSPWWRTHWRVILPHAKPGIASGSVTVFMLAAGSILVPTLLASTNSRWFTEVIYQWMFESQDWNTGSAYAFMLMILCTVFVSVVMRLFKVKLSDIAK
ncbi:MAG: ABC transporter permease [Rhizobiales bacterium]|nr:ABC transporter permease [Hyphomicrobiales bacterium]MBI3671964.1 ABC transporter permease [Hyphomicrobiales bacterium]